MLDFARAEVNRSGTDSHAARGDFSGDLMSFRVREEAGPAQLAT